MGSSWDVLLSVGLRVAGLLFATVFPQSDVDAVIRESAILVTRAAATSCGKELKATKVAIRRVKI